MLSVFALNGQQASSSTQLALFFSGFGRSIWAILPFPCIADLTDHIFLSYIVSPWARFMEPCPTLNTKVKRVRGFIIGTHAAETSWMKSGFGIPDIFQIFLLSHKLLEFTPICDRLMVGLFWVLLFFFLSEEIQIVDWIVTQSIFHHFDDDASSVEIAQLFCLSIDILPLNIHRWVDAV